MGGGRGEGRTRLSAAGAIVLLAGSLHLHSHRSAAQPAEERGELGQYVRTTYVGAVAVPSIRSAMSTFMTKPIDAIRYSQPAHSLDMLHSTEAMRQWLYAQVLAMDSMPDSSFTMFYAGLEDGRFIGYYDPLRYTFRPAHEARASQPTSEELCFSPDRSHVEHSARCAAVSLDRSATTCTEGVARPECDLLEATDGSAACPVGCTFTAAGENTPANCTGDGGGSPCVHIEEGLLWDRYAPFTLAMGSSNGVVNSPADSYHCRLTTGGDDLSATCTAVSSSQATCEYSANEDSCTSSSRFPGTDTAKQVSQTCTGERKGGVNDRSCTVSCTGTDDGSGTACALNTEKTACAVEDGDCEFVQCCDKDIRTYYYTGLSDNGSPISLYKWATYDPRERPWYKEEMQRTDASQRAGGEPTPGPTGWSSIYPFSTTGELGITATGTMTEELTRGSDIREVDIVGRELHPRLGVFAIDYTLNDISRMLNRSKDGQDVCRQGNQEVCWSYVVETTGNDAGKLIGVTSGEVLYDKSSKQRLLANRSVHYSIAQSARRLAQNGWQPGYVIETTGFSNTRYEAVATAYTEGGLRWLIVAGQDIRCGSNEVWIFGDCEICPAGERPNADATQCVACPPGYSSENTTTGESTPGMCYQCPDGYKPNPSGSVCQQCDDTEAGVGGLCEVCPVQDGLLPNHERTSCVCPPGTFALGLSRDMGGSKCEACSVLREKPHMGEGRKSEQDVLWEHPRYCPGGPPEETLVCPQKGLFIHIDQAHVGCAISATCPLVQLVPCNACEGAPGCSFQELDSDGDGWLEGNEVNNCTAAHKGFLCAECVEDHTNINGDCVYCTKVNWSLVFSELLAATAIGTFLMYNTIKVVCPPEEAKDVFDSVDTDGNGYLEADEVKDLLDRMGDPVSGMRLESTLKDMTGRSGQLNLATIHISRHQFYKWCQLNQNQAGMGVYIFFVQTFGMIAASKNLFNFLEIANLDTERAAKACMWPPHSLVTRLLGILVVPIIASIAIGLIWAIMRRYKFVMRKHHLQRGAIQAVRFSFAPVTRKCLEMLVCQDALDRTVLASDQSKECWQGPHVVTAVVAISLLVLYTVVIPTFWLNRVKRFLSKTNKLKDCDASSIASDESQDTIAEHTHKSTVWVGDVPDAVARQGAVKADAILRTIFSDYGTPVAVQIRIKLPKTTGSANVNKSWALVTFMREQGASNALGQPKPQWTDEQTGEVFQLKVKRAGDQIDKDSVVLWSTPRESLATDVDIEDGSTDGSNIQVAGDRVLMVHNIGYDYGDETELHAVFSRFGDVEHVTVRNRTDDVGKWTGTAGANTSYALVKMVTDEGVRAATRASEDSVFDRYKSHDQKEPLDVQRFDSEKAAKSTGAMAGALQSGHGTLAAMWKRQTEATRRGLQESFVLKPKCWDELTRVQTPEAYWWFVFIMFLKLLVNFIFIAGDSLNFNWGMWLQILLITAALISFWVKPYTVDNDNALEQVIFLSLATVLSVINSGLDPNTDLATEVDGYGGETDSAGAGTASSSGWDPWDIAVVVLCCVVASVIGLYPTAANLYAQFSQKRRIQKGVVKGRIASTLDRAIPAFNQFSAATRDEITDNEVEVEVFDLHEIVMKEGESADAFYIIEEGDALVTVHGRPVKKLTTGDYFGEAALVNPNAHGKRTATVTAVTHTLVCFRITRGVFQDRLTSDGHALISSEFTEHLKDYDERDAKVLELEREDKKRRDQARETGGFATMTAEQEAQDAAAAAAVAASVATSDYPLPASPSMLPEQERLEDAVGESNKSSSTAALEEVEAEEARKRMLQEQLERIRADPNAVVNLPEELAPTSSLRAPRQARP